MLESCYSLPIDLSSLTITSYWIFFIFGPVLGLGKSFIKQYFWRGVHCLKNKLQLSQVQNGLREYLKSPKEYDSVTAKIASSEKLLVVLGPIYMNWLNGGGMGLADLEKVVNYPQAENSEI